MLRNERTNEIDGLVYLDLNDFKALNDQHGHITGDFVLCEYAQRLKKAVRKGDTVARIGGDEFVILLENLGTGMEQAIATMVQIESKLRRISDEPIQLTNVEWICASSIGMKLFTSGECSAEQLLEDADRDMYKKKMEARQMVEWSEKIVA
jgi:diguanylate cyclase (GGDEF)-like protein